ncbi:MAG: ABC transporter substrate-binding protein [Gammaproteobacteria bacterium]|nr:ABC transporter substrate-binding protein [Gammaproteobacteria bacterium]MCP5198001.1 ABC transporter substrate-binding protein [Gammaproteobacteria bacterium]
MVALTDALGIRHAPAERPARIVSLVPSITELLFALKLADHIVGRTHYCIHPQPAVATIPSVGGTKKIHYARLRALQPTHIILNIDENPRELAERLSKDGFQIIVTHPLAPEDNLPLYRLLGKIFHREAEAERLAAGFERALAELHQQDWPRQQVLYLIWRQPWMGVSRETYIARMLALVGWDTLPTESATRYPVLDLNHALLDSADLILFSSEPYRFQRADLEAFARNYGCPLEKLQLIDGEMTAWYGSRAIAGLAYLGRLAQAAQNSAIVVSQIAEKTTT